MIRERFSLKAISISFPWPRTQKQKMVKSKNNIPGKKSHNDFNNWEMNLKIREAVLAEVAIL
jgi:hypothetical protein